MDQEVLRAPLVIEYPFSRTVGPAVSAFLTGLREQIVLGIRAEDGRVLVPPTEFDPVTAGEIDGILPNLSNFGAAAGRPDYPSDLGFMG